MLASKGVTAAIHEHPNLAPTISNPVFQSTLIGRVRMIKIDIKLELSLQMLLGKSLWERRVTAGGLQGEE